MMRNKKKSNPVPLKHAVKKLKENYEKIDSVQSWANLLGYSRSHFSRKFKEYYGDTPKEILKQFRKELIDSEILKDPEAIGYKIAVNAGLNCEKALHKFLNTHYEMTLNELRQELL